MQGLPSCASSPQVRLHGDFGPANILLARDGRRWGSTRRWKPSACPRTISSGTSLSRRDNPCRAEFVLPPFAGVRRRMEDRLLAGC